MRKPIYAQTTLNASGYGTCSVQVPVGEDWKTVIIRLGTSTAVAEPEADLYLNTVSPLGKLEGTRSGSNDATDTAHELGPGDILIAEWRSGDVGAVATMTGTIEATRRAF